MSANIEYALLTRAIKDNDFATLEKARITSAYFTSAECREVFGYLRNTFHNAATAGQTPSEALVHSHFPSFYFAPAFDTLDILCVEMKKEHARMELMKLANEIQLQAEKDPMAAAAALRAESAKISSITETSFDISFSSAYSMIRDRYDTVANAGGILGVPYPWAPLNEETQGMLPGQFIVLYGRPKSMKTWVGLNIGIDAYLRSRRRVLLYSREMSVMELLGRAAATIAKVEYASFKNGKLQPELKEKAFTILQELVEDEKMAGAAGKKMPGLFIVSDRGSTEGAGGVAWLQSKIRDYQPDLVIVDGMYLMSDDRSKTRSTDWRQIANISQDLKITAQQFNVPIIGITQANRAAQKTKGDDLTELAFSDSLGQDADAVFRIVKMDNKETGLTELLITAPGLRDGKFDGIIIHGQPGVNFGYLRAYVEQNEEAPAGAHGGSSGQRRVPYGEGEGRNATPRPTFRKPDFMGADPTVGRR